MVLLDIDQFLLRMGRLYKDKKAGGSVWVTFKRSAPPAPPAVRPGSAAEQLFFSVAADRSARARSIAGPEGAEGAEASEGAVGGG